MSFRKIYDALTRGPLIIEAFGEIEQMHDLTKEHFQEAFGCFVENRNGACATNVAAEDKKINEMEKKIRKQIFEYLAVSSTPNVNASLILVSTVIDYERIGDISKNIAQLPQMFPWNPEENDYYKDTVQMKENILSIFDLTKGAVKDGDIKKAHRAIALHDDNKEIHNKLLKRLNEDTNLSVKEGIFYALMGYYLRRINGHLSNVSSTALGAFPKMGFTGPNNSIEADD